MCCNQMVTTEIRLGKLLGFGQTRVKLFPNFTSILDRIDRELLHSPKRLELKFGLSSEFFDKIPVRILLDVLLRVFRFSKESFYALASSFMRF